MGQSTTPKALALGVSLSLACGLLPGAAFADEAPEDDASANAADSARGTAGGADSDPSGAAAKPDGYDKADFYSDNPVAPIARTLAVPLAANTQLRSLSNEMKYFARFESNQNYDQGLSWGDGYHAMGYYQFDNRYSLKSFISYCYNFDPVKYWMFSWVPSANISGDLYDGNADRLTDIGQQLNESWHAAYAADPAEFSALQDTFAYDNYYVPAETYLASRGIDISNRADSVKGLCWGLANLFGTSGWHKFVGGWSDGYVNGTYYNSYNYPGAGLTNDMTDEQFVTTLCDYVIAHVAEFYHGQPQYHEGWTNRYKQEKELCLSLLPEKPTVPPVEEEPPAADSPAVPPVGNTPPEEGSGDAPSGETKPPESVLPPEVNPPAAPEGNPPSAPNEPAPPANDGAGQADPDETPKPDGDSAAPTPPASPSNPENTTPPAGSETTPPEETKPPESATPPESPETTPGSGLQEPTKEVANSSKPSLEEPTAPAQEPVNLPSYFINDAEGKPWVWAQNSKGKLEKRSITLGEYNTETDTYPVTDGLTAEDYIAYPDDSLKAGMTCITYDDATFDPSASGGEVYPEGGGEKIDENVPMDGMDGGDMPAENDTVTDDGGTAAVIPGGAAASASAVIPPMEG